MGTSSRTHQLHFNSLTDTLVFYCFKEVRGKKNCTGQTSKTVKVKCAVFFSRRFQERFHCIS